MNAGFKIKRRDDLTPACIALKFRVTTTADENTYTQVISDIAGTIAGTQYEGIGLTGALYTVASFAGGSPVLLGSGTMTTLQNMSRDFAASTATIDMEGNQSNSARCVISTVGVNLADFSSGGFWQHVFPEFATMATAPSFFSGDSLSVKIDDPQNNSGLGDGCDLNQSGAGNLMSTYQYMLTDGQVAPWMLNGNLPNGTQVKVVQAVINAKFIITKTTVVPISGSPVNIPTGFKPYVEKTARVTLLTIPGGLYQTQTSYTPGEVIPYGLAGYIYNIEKIPQYEGTFTIQEQEITDPCPPGNNLNISGGLAEWAAMQACVQQISYDLTAGRTTLTFGPAARLGAKDFVERLRTNRNPIRPLYGIGYNVANSPNSQAGAQLGNSVAQRGPSATVDNEQHTIFPANLTDLGANLSAYLTGGSPIGAPGVTHDVRASGQPNYGNISGLSAPNAPTILLASGSGGALSACIRISIADLVGTHKQAWFQPMSICVNASGTPTTMTTYVLCTTPE
jgi:hypothetical protein